MIRQNAYGVNVSKWKSVFILRHFYWVDEGKMGSGIFSCSLLKLLKEWHFTGCLTKKIRLIHRAMRETDFYVWMEAIGTPQNHLLAPMA